MTMNIKLEDQLKLDGLRRLENELLEDLRNCKENIEKIESYYVEPF